jgi:hypothetical protein
VEQLFWVLRWISSKPAFPAPMARPSVNDYEKTAQSRQVKKLTGVTGTTFNTAHWFS